MDIIAKNGVHKILGGIAARGHRQLQKHWDGGHLSRMEAMDAMCYYCQGGFADGRADCTAPQCPLYDYSPEKYLKTTEAVNE